MLERDQELRKIHKHIVSESGVNKKYLTRAFIVEQIQKCSAPRFYISEDIARRLVTAHYNGKIIRRTQLKQMMTANLVEVFEKVRDANLNAPMEEIWQMVVEHPAKSFYLSPARIIEIIYQYHDRK